MEDLLNGDSGLTYSQIQDYVNQAQQFDLQELTDNIQSQKESNDAQDASITAAEEGISALQTTLQDKVDAEVTQETSQDGLITTAQSDISSLQTSLQDKVDSDST